jgi:hypothetical protein
LHPWDGDGLHTTRCDDAGACWASWQIVFDVADGFNARAASVAYRTSKHGPVELEPAVLDGRSPVPGYQRYVSRIWRHTLPAASYDGVITRYSPFRIELLPIASGERGALFDGNRIAHHVTYVLDRTNEWNIDADPLYCDPRRASWTGELVDPEPGSGFHSQLALDRQGHAHIAYQVRSASGSKLKYAVGGGAGWSVQVVDEGKGEVGSGISMILDARDRAHLAYFRRLPDRPAELVYTTEQATGWRAQIAARGDLEAQRPALVLDASDRAAIAFADHAGESIRLAREGEGSFQVETIATEVAPGRGTSLVLRGGALHLVYDEPGRRRLVYAVRDPHGRLETTSKTFDQPFFSYAVALDGTGAPRIVAEMERRTVLLSVDHGHWTAEVITGEGDFYSTAVDGQGQQQVALFDVPSGHLDLISRTPDGWFRQTVDPGNEAGFFASLALDARGAVHISYRDLGSDGLKYVSPPSGGRLTSQTPGTPE